MNNSSLEISTGWSQIATKKGKCTDEENLYGSLGLK
jgi:hypothetical protein